MKYPIKYNLIRSDWNNREGERERAWKQNAAKKNDKKVEKTQ